MLKYLELGIVLLDGLIRLWAQNFFLYLVLIFRTVNSFHTVVRTGLLSWPVLGGATIGSI